MQSQKHQIRKLGLILLILMCFSLLMKTTSAQSEDEYSIRFTHMVVFCNTANWGGAPNWLGFDFQYAGIWKSSSKAILTDHFNAPGEDSGGNLYYASPGTGSFVYGDSNGSWGAIYRPEMQYPYTFTLTIRMIVGGHPQGDAVDQVSGGTEVYRAIATATCTQPGYTPVTFQYGLGDDSSGFDPGDGRLNVDPGAPVAIYCQGKDVQIYAINSNSQGELALMVNEDQISGDPPAENTLIAQVKDIRLYRLTTGELQVNVGPDFEGKEYVFIWDGCDG